MTTLDAIFAGGKWDWETRPELFNELDAEFRFTLDPCATKGNAKCARFYTKEQDGLFQPWEGSVFVNPPYWPGVSPWVEKATEEARRGVLVVMLLPARTDSWWWHEFIWDGNKPRDGVEVRFLKGRVRFVGAATAAPFASVVVVFRSGTQSHCGHSVSAIVSSDEGTNYCGECVKEDAQAKERAVPLAIHPG